MLGRRSFSFLPQLATSLRACRPCAVSAIIPATSTNIYAGAQSRSMVSRTLALRDAAAKAAKEAAREQAAKEEMQKSETFASITGETPQKIKDLADQILALTMVETAELTEFLKKRLGISDAALMGGMVMGGGGGAGGGGGQADAAPAKEEPKKEKTEFTLKLESFNAADKLKVIKEVRGITGLGLKESKEMVEGAPSVIKEGVNKEDSEKFAKLIEAAGGKVSIS